MFYENIHEAEGTREVRKQTPLYSDVTMDFVWFLKMQTISEYNNIFNNFHRSTYQIPLFEMMTAVI